MNTSLRERDDQYIAGPADSSPSTRGPLNASLLRLRLTAADIEGLKRQGSVRVERRGTSCRWKLRFRRGARQIVRYLRGPEEAARVREDLASLQAAHRKSRELSRLTRAARKALRESKHTLAPHLAAAGYAFHGLAIRKRRPLQPEPAERRPRTEALTETVVK